MKFTGTQVSGRKRARTLGFPTINLIADSTEVVPDGIYAARVTIRGKQYKAAMHCGASPTFNDAQKTTELYLVGLSEEDIKRYELVDLTNVLIAIETIKYLRPVLTFSSKEELIKQIEQDVKDTMTAVPLTA